MELDFDSLLHIGLAIGAIFQLICILAIIVLPSQEEEQSSKDSECDSKNGTTTVLKGATKPSPSGAGTLTKRGKGKDKKLKK